MGLIKNYSENLVLEASDKLIGSAGEAEATKNFTLGDIADFVNSSKYSVYTAVLKQSGTNNPVATILDNTIGSIVWTRTSTGIYTGTLSGAFTDSTKFWAIAKTMNPSITAAQIDVVLYRDTANTVVVDVSNDIDGLNCSIEIRMYN